MNAAPKQQTDLFVLHIFENRKILLMKLNIFLPSDVIVTVLYKVEVHVLQFYIIVYLLSIKECF